jgi:hypothetical protein
VQSANRKLTQEGHANPLPDVNLPNLSNLLPSITTNPRVEAASPAADADAASPIEDSPMGASSGEQEASETVTPAEEVPSDSGASTEEAPAEGTEEADASAAAAPLDASTADAEGASDPASADAVGLPDPIKDATTAESAAASEGPAHLSSPLNLGNFTHTFGGGKGKSLLPEVTITKEFDQPSNYSDDFKLEKPHLPAKPKFSLTKIEHIMDKPQMPDESKKKIHITEKKWKDTVRILKCS